MVVLTDHLSRCSTPLKALQDQTYRILSDAIDQAPRSPAPRRRVARRLTASEVVAVARAYQAGTEMRDLAVQFEVHRTSISRALHQLGIHIRGQGLRQEDVSEAARLYVEGWSLARLGERYGCAHTDVRNKLMAFGVKMRPRRGWQY